MLEQAVEWIAALILRLGYPAILILMMLESLVLPLPSEIVLPFAGYLVSTGGLNLWLAVLAATIGSVLGSMLSYEVSSRGGRPFLRRYGKYFFLNETHLAWSEAWFLRFGEKAVFFSRLIPVVRHFISIPAGTTKMHRGKFIAYTALGAGIWNFFLLYIGFILGTEWKNFRTYTQPIDILALCILLLIGCWWLFKKIEKHTILKYVRPNIIRTKKLLTKKLQGTRKRNKSKT